MVFLYLWKLGQPRGITATGHSSLSDTQVYKLSGGGWSILNTPDFMRAFPLKLGNP